MKLDSLRVLNSEDRNSTLDVFRGLAVLAVLLFHFNQLLPFGGSLGVDLFFVISGCLVGGILSRSFEKKRKINFWKFILQRGFKIWPSYYTFLLVGNFLVYYFFNSFAPGEYIQFHDYERYLFFYQNYTGGPMSNVFYHVWSLCVEEHFYILLPLMFIFLQKFNANKYYLFYSIVCIIIAGFLFKTASLYLTNSKDTYAGTHNRIDALAWGVMLNWVITYSSEWLGAFKRSYLLTLLGVLLLAILIFLSMRLNIDFYHAVVFHSLTPVAFFLMILGIYNLKFKGFKAIRFIAYYSYNLYLWHPVFSLAVGYYIGYNVAGFIVYLFGSFTAAMLFTVIIEERFLKLRPIVIDKLFRKKQLAQGNISYIIPEAVEVKK